MKYHKQILFFKQKKNCNNQITKKYHNLSQLQADNNRKLRWDPELDDTPIDWIEQIKLQFGAQDLDGSELRKHLLNKVNEQETHIISRKLQQDRVDDILNGGKTVQIGDFAILYTEDTLANQLWKRVVTGQDKQEIWVLHGEQEIGSEDQLCFQGGKDITTMSNRDFKNPKCLPTGDSYTPCLPKKVERIKRDIKYTEDIIDRLQEELTGHQQSGSLLVTLQNEKNFFQKMLQHRIIYQKYQEEKLSKEKQNRIAEVPSLNQNPIRKKLIESWQFLIWNKEIVN